MEQVKERINSLDYLRAFAIICVVFCHAIQSYYFVNKIDIWNAYSVSSKMFMLITMTISRLGVPIFLMLTRNFSIKKRFRR